MPPSTTFDEPPEFDVGDRVVTVNPVGPRWHRVRAQGAAADAWRRAPAGTPTA